jgi:hypothetical protein
MGVVAGKAAERKRKVQRIRRRSPVSGQIFPLFLSARRT